MIVPRVNSRMKDIAPRPRRACGVCPTPQLVRRGRRVEASALIIFPNRFPFVIFVEARTTPARKPHAAVILASFGVYKALLTTDDCCSASPERTALLIFIKRLTASNLHGSVCAGCGYCPHFHPLHFL